MKMKMLQLWQRQLQVSRAKSTCTLMALRDSRVSAHFWSESLSLLILRKIRNACTLISHTLSNDKRNNSLSVSDKKKNTEHTIENNPRDVLPDC